VRQSELIVELYLNACEQDEKEEIHRHVKGHTF
jgi:hypothetical protein